MDQIKKFLKPALLFLALFFLILNGSSQTISPRFFSQNAWMPDTIGNASACIQPPCVLYGQLHNQWPKIKESGSQMVRFGGIQVDRNMPTNYQYLKMIDSIRAKGMEPIIQVPFYMNRYSATQAAQIVQYINVTKGKNIKYWIIGNEPDHVYGYTTAAQVAAYIRPFASAMKAVDPSIKIIGPETAWFNFNIINGLTTPNGPDDITGVDAFGRYYIDILSFHAYAFNGTQTRATMISNLMSGSGLNSNLAYLNGRIASCNSTHGRTGTNALTSAVTEANVNWQNASTDNLYGTGVNSFIGGQFVAEMFGIGLMNNVDIINMWSVVEGNNTALNIGYIDAVTGNKKPSYYHFQMMAENFSGSYITSTSTQTNVKVFSSKNSSVTTVMIMNQELTTNYNFTLRLNTATATGTNTLKINVNANIAQEYNDVSPNQSTILLQFDNQGNLVKKISYSLSGQAVSNLPPVVLNYTPMVTVVAPPVNMTPQVDMIRCNGKTTTLTATSGTNQIQWFSSATSTNVIASGSVFVTPYLSVSGNSTVINYYAQAVGNNSVSLRTPVTVTLHPRPSISVNSGTICNGGAFVMIPSGASTYTFSSGSATVYPGSNTSYSVMGTSPAGCNSTIAAVAQVTVVPRPTLTVNSGSICQGASFVMNPTGASSYSFSGGSATVSPGITSNFIVTGTSSLGCSNTTTASVTVNPNPVISVSSGTVCEGNIFVMSPSGAATYTFSSGSATVSPTANTSYSVTGTSAAGCVSGVSVVNVTVHARPVVSVNSGSVCSGNVFVLQPSGAASYIFSGGSATVSPTTNNSYTVTGISAQGCSSSNSAVAQLTVYARPVVSVNSGSICEGNSFVLTPSGASSYSFQGGNATVNPLTSNSYTVTGFSAEGCASSNTAVANVTVHAAPALSVNSGTICSGSVFNFNPSGASSYSVSGGLLTVSPISNTSYTITGASAYGCVSQTVSQVVVNPLPVISVNSGSICAGTSFTIVPSGAATYTVLNAGTVVSPSVTNVYMVSGTSAQGCVSAATAASTVVVKPAAIVSVNSGTICKGGSFTMIPAGATNYTFSNGSAIVSPLSTSSYTVYGANGACVGQAVSMVTVLNSKKESVCKTLGSPGLITAPAVAPNSITLSSTPESTVQPVNEIENGSKENQPDITGLENKTGKVFKLSVFPNPNNGEFTIDTEFESEYQLVDLTGNILRQGNLNAGKTGFNISDMQTGIYIIKISRGENAQFARILKQ